MVGNGLSYQTFVEGLDGLIAIDTGVSVEEMEGGRRIHGPAMATGCDSGFGSEASLVGE